MEKFDSRLPLRYGIIAFALVFTIGMMMCFFYKMVFSSLLFINSVRFLSLLLALFLAIWSGITYRRDNGGVISFGHAFLAVYLVFALYSLGYASSTFFVNNILDKEYPKKAAELIKKNISHELAEKNVPEEDIRERVQDYTPEKLDPPFWMTLTRWLGMCAFISFLIAAFIKRGSSDLISSGAPPEPMKTI